MTTNVEQFASAGIDSVYWAVNSSGVAYGITGSLSAGEDASMARLLGVNQFGIQVQQPQQVNITGDDGVQATFFFEPQELPSGNLQLGVWDANLVAKAQGTNVYADGDHDVSVLQPEQFDFAELSFIINSQAKSRASGSSGEAGFQVWHFPKIQCVPLGPEGGLTSAGPTNYTHALIAQKSAVWAWNKALSNSDEGTTSAVSWGPANSENRVLVHTFIADGSTTTFTLDQTPAASNGNKVKAWKDGTAQAYTTNYTVSGTTFTLAAAGSSGEIWTVRYEYTA